MTDTKPIPQPVPENDFFSRDIPEQYQILGLKLLPLSIGRYRRMARYGIGFVSESKSNANGQDLLLGVLICSMSCKAWDALALTDKTPKIISSWMKQVNAAPPFYLRGRVGRSIARTWVGKRWREKHSFNLLEKCRLFKEYIEDAQQFPKYILHKNSDRTSVSHWSHNIEVILRGELGWTRDEIEERALSNAIADYFKHMENNGILTILTDKDFDDIKLADERIAAGIAEWEAKQKGGK